MTLTLVNYKAMLKIDKKTNENERGAALLITLLLSGVLLSIALALSAIFIPKVRVSAESKKSVTAIYAADSAIEWCIYVNRQTAIPLPTMGNGATFINADTGVTPVAADCLSSSVKITGIYGGVVRSFEITF